MTTTSISTTLATPEDTARFAARLSTHLQRGDTLLLSGEIGSGKTHLSRNLIQSLMSVPEDVPSPTFTLVQAYDTKAGPVWHCDLYRLGTVDEIEELGLTEAFETAICLIEWPDKLGALTPQSAASLRFETDSDIEDVRHLTLSWSDPKWTPKIKAAS